MKNDDFFSSKYFMSKIGSLKLHRKSYSTHFEFQVSFNIVLIIELMITSLSCKSTQMKICCRRNAYGNILTLNQGVEFGSFIETLALLINPSKDGIHKNSNLIIFSSLLLLSFLRSRNATCK